MHLSGKTINLMAGDYTATIVTVGGAIAGVKYRGHDITMPFNPESVPVAHQGKILAPWPNRITDGKYTFAGHNYQLGLTDVKTMSASHGLVAWKEWTITKMRGCSVELETYVTPTEGYPFLIKMTARYELIAGMGLKVDITAVNTGTTAAPYGVGMHPYLSCDGEVIDNCELKCPLTQVYTLTDRMVPDELVPAEQLGFDFSTQRKIGSTKIDHCFVSPDKTHINTIMLENQHLQVYLKSNAPYIQLFTAEKLGRRCLAVEPMSCTANAFNNGNGLIILEEQQYYTLSFVIGALEK